MINKVNIDDKLTNITDYWNPRIAGELNGQEVKLVKFKDEFVWHSHTQADEMFFVLEGEFIMEFRDHEVLVQTNEFIIVPRGVEHRPVAKTDVSVMLFEPKGTVNTGSTSSNFTKTKLDNI